MGFLKKATPHTKVEVMKSTHGQTFVTWPTNMVGGVGDLPALPVGGNHAQSRQWVLADRTAVLILNGDPQVYAGGVVRHTFDVVSSSWSRKNKTLTSLVKHPANPEISFVITTNGVGCSCTQGAAGNAGPIGEPYDIYMVKTDAPEFDWFTMGPS